MAKIAPKDIQKRLDQITHMIEDMVPHADKVSLTRCPYRNRTDHCTAAFRCRNQKVLKGQDTEELACLHDGTFDYRSAWENNPHAYEKLKAKVKNIRTEGKKRRAKKVKRHEA